MGDLEYWKQRAEVAENTIQRLFNGVITRAEMNALCHNLHLNGFPMTRQEHEAECAKFRDSLFECGTDSAAANQVNTAAECNARDVDVDLL